MTVTWQSGAAPVTRVLAQDLAADSASDVTHLVTLAPDGSSMTVPGHLVDTIGKAAQPAADISDPGALFRITR